MQTARSYGDMKNTFNLRFIINSQWLVCIIIIIIIIIIVNIIINIIEKLISHICFLYLPLKRFRKTGKKTPTSND